MVAEESSRRKGIAYEALTLFMAYCVKHLVSTLSIALCPHSSSDLKARPSPQSQLVLSSRYLVTLRLSLLH